MANNKAVYQRGDEPMREAWFLGHNKIALGNQMWYNLEDQVRGVGEGTNSTGPWFVLVLDNEMVLNSELEENN